MNELEQTSADNKRNIQEDIVTELENQNLKLDELAKLSVTETCLDLNAFGLNVSKEFDLDPDGLNQGQTPIKAWCDLPEGITKIGMEIEIEVPRTDSPNTYTYNFEYEPRMIDQMKALIDSSSECFQEITFYCLSTPLIAPVKHSEF